MRNDQITTFGDVRRMIIDTIVALRDEKMSPDRGMAIAANMKTLNDNIEAEIKAAKMSLLTEDRAHKFGRVVGMGQRLIGNDKVDPA
jgi:hypothetical protein